MVEQVPMVKFVDELPERGPRPSKWGPVADELRARPGEWALIAENVNGSLVTQIRNGVMIPFRPPGSFDAVGRNQKLGYGEVYARFVGGDTA